MEMRIRTTNALALAAASAFVAWMAAGQVVGSLGYRTIPAAAPETLTAARVPAEGPASKDWTRSHGGSGSTRYSTLRQITRTNVRNLTMAWTYRSGDGKGNIQANPVIVDGILYAPTVGEHVVALNAATGVEVWRFKPEGRPAHRGLVYWSGGGGQEPRLYFTAGTSLYALAATTGKPVPSFGINGRVVSGGVVAPAIYRDVIVVANWNRIEGFELRSGRALWTFHTLGAPGQGEKPKRGGNTWGGISMDTARGIVYASTGSPHPNFVGADHHGLNEHANSVIALEAATGKLLWSFQEIRHDIWDLDIPAPPNLVTVRRGGRMVDAVAQVTKLGNTLVLDRVTGKPLFPFRLRRAPASTLPGEQAAEYQPDVELPQPFARQIFTESDVTNISEAARASVMKQIAPAKFGWFEPFEVDRPTVFFGIYGGAEWTGAAIDEETSRLYVTANELPSIITVSKSKRPMSQGRNAVSPGARIYRTKCAVCHGERMDGNGMAPPLIGLERRMTEGEASKIVQNGLRAMPSVKMAGDQAELLLSFLYGREAGQSGAQSAPVVYASNGYPKLRDLDGYPGCTPPWGTLNAIDLNTGKLVWKVPLGEYEELTRRGIAQTGTENFGGATVTAGGVVFAGGTKDLKIRAFDKKTGKELWSYKLPFGGYAPPATYEAGGRQFVVIAATGGGKLGGEMGDAYVAFALPR